MITTIEGTLVECTPLQAIINVGGIGYEVNIPLTTTEKLPCIGSIVKLYTLVVYREDAQTLYGFHDRTTKEVFRLFVEKVNGVGPKTALGILSHLSINTLKTAVMQQNVALLSKCPGIGKKTAERLILELKDHLVVIENGPLPDLPVATVSRLGANITEQTPITSSVNIQQDAISALIALGYKAADADKSIRKAIAQSGADISTAQLIKAALNN